MVKDSTYYNRLALGLLPYVGWSCSLDVRVARCCRSPAKLNSIEFTLFRSPGFAKDYHCKRVVDESSDRRDFLDPKLGVFRESRPSSTGSSMFQLTTKG